ncbi:Solute carrier family 45 member 3 [Nibea albiflora]|uniref:Solute carrier family 45 member 3 n=1 Tax=Nibea albiflora TaxID=240163 RepID=A0ACB7EZM1_NIBAL|nr:Solute carrier family 45 member 3 [Nibea albiflora]
MQVENPPQGLVWRLLMVNALSCGLEACMAAGTVYIPPLLLQAGMEERYMTMVLAVGPVLGLIFIPMIGSASDSRQGRFGRRRPFIWMLGLGVLLSLQVIPQAWRLAALMSPHHPHWLEAALQAGAVCLMDFCGQACLTLLLALLSDLFPVEEENRRAFSVNSLMISLGGCLGFFLPAVDWSQVPLATYLGGQEAFVYTLLTSLFLSCVLTTAFIPEKTRTGGGERKTSPLKSLNSRCFPHLFLPRPQCFLVTLSRCTSACVRVASLGLFLQCVVDFWVALLGARVVYISAVALLVLATIVMSVSESVITVTVMVAVTGYSLCVLQVLPYTLLCLYHSNRQAFFTSSKPRPPQLSESDKPLLTCGPATPHAQDTGRLNLPGTDASVGSPHVSLFEGGGNRADTDCAPVSQRGMCFDMAILDSAYLLSQVTWVIRCGHIVSSSAAVQPSLRQHMAVRIYRAVPNQSAPFRASLRRVQPIGDAEQDPCLRVVLRCRHVTLGKGMPTWTRGKDGM